MSTARKPLVKPGLNRSFGRVAKRLSPAAQTAVDMAVDAWRVPVDGPVDLQKLFPEAAHLVVELGAGTGDQILARAAANPAHGHIACEVYRNGLKTMVRGIEKQSLENLRLCPDDARLLLAALPDASVDLLLVLYPDPWPKFKHRKRRLIQADTLKDMARVLKPTGTLLVATDIVDYALWTLHQMYAEGSFFPIATGPAAWVTPPQGWVPTGYERKAGAEGRTPFYLQFQHKDQVTTQIHNQVRAEKDTRNRRVSIKRG